MITGLSHVAVVTRDLARALAFYRDIIGFEVVGEFAWEAGNAEIDRKLGVPDTAARVAVLRLPLGNGFIELMEFTSPAAADVTVMRGVHLPGLAHFAFEVDDTQAEYERLQAAGMIFYSPPACAIEGAPYTVFGVDPDGNHIELQSVLPPDSPFAMLSLRLPPPRTN